MKKCKNLFIFFRSFNRRFSFGIRKHYFRARLYCSPPTTDPRDASPKFLVEEADTGTDRSEARAKEDEIVEIRRRDNSLPGCAGCFCVGVSQFLLVGAARVQSPRLSGRRRFSSSIATCLCPACGLPARIFLHIKLVVPLTIVHSLP